MRPEFLALYGGPDQIMGVTSGIAAITGLAMVFWNKIVVFFGKIANKLHPSRAIDSEPEDASVKD